MKKTAIALALVSCLSVSVSAQEASNQAVTAQQNAVTKQVEKVAVSETQATTGVVSESDTRAVSVPESKVKPIANEEEYLDSIAKDDLARSEKTKTRAKKTADKVTALIEEQSAKPVEKRIAPSLLSKAKCIAVFPSVIQGGLGIGAKTGQGVVSCKGDNDEFGAPVFLRLSAINFGLQAGVQESDVVMLVMNNKGLDSLFTGKPVTGAEVGLAVGPIGAQRGVDIDVLLSTPLITYTRNKGLYGGLALQGATILSSKKLNKATYGDDFGTAKQLLPMAVSTDSADYVVSVASAFDNFVAQANEHLAKKEKATESSESQVESDETEDESGDE